MKPVNQAGQVVILKLVQGLAVGGERKVDKNPPFQAVHVIRRSQNLYTINHFVEVNGDLCMDPGMDFFHAADGLFYPTAITQTVGIQLPTRELVVWEGGRIKGFLKRAQSEAATFAGMWLRNIKMQQEI